MTNIRACTFVLAVRDLAASRRFYTEQLGFVEDLAVAGWSFLSRGACEIRIGHCPDAMPASQLQDHAWFAYLQVADARALHDEYAAAGVTFWHPLQDKPWGCREFAVVTPDGHRIVFGQDLEAPADPP
jgi:catechol 2,3-dioxygenase-like lactoylglutathione lyase family enzyme